MMKYVEYSKEKIEHLEANMINSESNLFNFISERTISFEYISLHLIEII